MPLLPPRLLLTITHQRRRRTPHRPSHTIAHPLTEIRQLALRLLTLTLQILLPALAFQALAAEQVAHRLLAGADGLVPPALAAVLVVFRCRAGGAEGEWSCFQRGFGGGVFGGGVGAFLVGLRLLLGDGGLAWGFGE